MAAPPPAGGVSASLVSAVGDAAIKTKTKKRKNTSQLWVYFYLCSKDYTNTAKAVFCVFCKAKNVNTPITGRLDTMANHLLKKRMHASKKA